MARVCQFYNVAMSHDEFTKLYKLMQNEFSSLRNKISDLTLDVKRDVNSYSNLVDAYAKRSETYHQKMLVLNHRVDRSEQWILKVADATHVKLVA